MENESRKSRNKTLQKVLLAVLSIILMTGIAFFMANVVHNNSSQPTSSKVKNGLSAYELAVEQGYKGDLNDWLKSLDGKSAFEIAKENGYSGTEKEWNKAVANVSKQNKSVITNAGFNKNGDFILTLLDGTDVNVSNVSNSKGKDGKNGTNGKNGANGKDGRSITLASVNSEGQLVITYSDGSSVNLDKLVGINGIDGKDGTDGKDGVGINTVNITGDGKLNITLTNGTTLNLGTIKGEKGDKGDTGVQGEKGDKGDTGEQGIQGVAGKDGKDGINGINGTDGVDGKDGVGIANILINTSGELELTFSDGQQINLGNVKGSKGDKGEKGDTGEQGIQGIAGKDGKDGINGTNGVDGKDGTNGKDGTDGQDGVGIANVTVSNEGALSVTLTNGTVLDLGNIKGANGIGISKSEVNASGELVLTYTDGTVKNLGNVVGANGADGQDGVGIKTVTLSSTGELMVTLSDNSVINLGNVKGEKGDKGDKGDKGARGEKGEKGDKGDTGRGIAKTELVNGELIITYTDGTKENLGSVSNAESEYSSGLQYTLNEDNNSYTLSSAGELFNSTKVVIPETYKGKPVTKIGERAFYSTQLYGSDSSKGAPINELILPSTIKSIALEAFYNCKIEKVVFEGTIEEWCSIQFIGISANPLYHPDNAKDNTKLYIDGELIETLVIPNSVSTISSYSFVDCGSLKEVVIPESVTSIEPHAFKNCGSLSSVEVKAPRGWYYKNGGYKYSISESTMSNKTLLAQKFVEGNPSNYYKN